MKQSYSSFDQLKQFYLLIIIFFPFQSIGQDFEWMRSTGEPHPDIAISYLYTVSSTTDAEGNTYIVGTLQGGADFDPSIGTAFEEAIGDDGGFIRSGFIQKIDTDGNFVWIKMFTGIVDEPGDCLPLEVTLSPTGNAVYIGGIYANVIDFDPSDEESIRTSTASEYDLFLVKLTSDGELEWVNTWGGLPGDFVEDVKVDVDGGVYLVGEFYGTIDFDPGPGVEEITYIGSGTDAFLLKLTSEGAFEWVNILRGDASSGIQQLAFDPSGNIFVVGYFDGLVDFDPDFFGSEYIDNDDEKVNFIEKFSPGGSFEWVTVFDKGLFATEEIIIDSDYHIYLAGDIFHADTIDFDPGDDEMLRVSDELVDELIPIDAFMAKFDTTAAPIWVNRYTGTARTRISSMLLSTCNKLYVTGFLREGSTNFGAYGDTLLLETIPGEGCGVGPTNFDFFLARYNLDGENEWITQSNGTDCSLGWGISQDGEGDLYFTGNYGGTVDFDFNDDDYFSTANNPDNDLYIVKMTKCSLDETTMFASACESYTTPSGDEVYTESGVYMDTLTNMCGCDSILSISLTISDPIDTELETEGGILTALETDANYQWINCKDSLPITGANEQTYYPMDGGSYAVIIEKGACTDTSDCISVGVHEILETNQNFTFNIYPNPTDGIVNLETTTDITLIITNSIGERITEYQVPEGKRVLDLHQYASGIYLLQITTQDGTMMNKKLILNN